jgi:hypothetical protein
MLAANIFSFPSPDCSLSSGVHHCAKIFLLIFTLFWLLTAALPESVGWRIFASGKFTAIVIADVFSASWRKFAIRQVVPVEEKNEPQNSGPFYQPLIQAMIGT